jgi:tRNA 2-selenouridine synthase
MDNIIKIEEFLELSKSIPVIDVRTPAEFIQGNIAGSINIPLFSDEERTIVGTLYKHANREKAVIQGLEFVGPKMAVFAKQALKIAKNKKLLLYCWRGGMRSNSMAWLFRSLNIEVATLLDGYKAYRRYGKEILAKEYNLIVLGGKTGSGKTEILHELKSLGEQVVDLEFLANHKGSAFGFIGQKEQPINEDFENQLIEQFLKINPHKRIWIEDESKNVGKNVIPDELFNQMKIKDLIFLEMPIELRVARLVNEYTDVNVEQLGFAVEKIRSRIGFENYEKAILFLKNRDFKSVAEITLRYYDKAYLLSLQKRDENKLASAKRQIQISLDEPKITAKELIIFANKNYKNENN